MHKKVLSLLMVCFFVVGCAGRQPAPIKISRADDYQKSCEHLSYELEGIQDEIAVRLPNADKTAKNTAVAVAGLFFAPAFLALDLNNAEQKEIDAYRARYDKLFKLYLEKDCKNCKRLNVAAEEMKVKNDIKQIKAVA